LLSAILFHIVIVYFPPFGISIAERTSSMARLSLEGHWDMNWHYLNPAYNPFPMDVSLFSTVSIITSIPYISKLNNWVIYLPFIIAFDLVLYSLTKRVTGSWVAGVLAIFILASTPPARIVGHGPKWIGNLLVLISALALIKAFEESSSRAKIIVANISYVAAIFFHPSAMIGAFFPFGIAAMSYFGKMVEEKKVRRRLSGSPLFRIVFAVFVVATLVRALYTSGYLEVILPSLKNFVLTMFGYIAPNEELAAVYELAVSPVNAYAWVVPVSMASALVIYSMLRKRLTREALTLTMYFVGAAFASIGLLSVLVKAGGFQGAMYPAFTFLIPAAAVVGERILKSSKILAAVALILMVLFVGVAITDPMLSKERYSEIGAGDIHLSNEDYIEARFLVDTVPSTKSLFAPYEIITCFDYLEVAEDKIAYEYFTRSADRQRVIIYNVTEHKELLSEVMYIWPQRWLPDIKSHLVDVPIYVLYDSDRYAIFEKTP